MNAELQRQYSRWYPLNPHPVQDRLSDAVHLGIRFPVVPAGRRSGKTERFKRFVAVYASIRPGPYFIGAPTKARAKKIFWNDMKALTLSACHSKKPSESELILFLPNGSEIHLIGLNNPELIEGIPWVGGGIDEFADIPEGSFKENILPSLNTYNPNFPDYRPFCWFVGVPGGSGQYSDLVDLARDDGSPEFALFHWPSSDILPADVIEHLRGVMSPDQFDREMGTRGPVFDFASGRIYPDYCDENCTDFEILRHEKLYWAHDQNFSPMSSAICVRRGESLYILDEIILESAVARHSAEEFVERYSHHQNKEVVLAGDPYGKRGEKHGLISDFKQIEEVLRLHGWKFTRMIPKKAPLVKVRHNSVRTKILSASGDRTFFVNPKKAKVTHKGFLTGVYMPGSTFQEKETYYQHVTTAVGGLVHELWPSDRRLDKLCSRIPLL